MELVRESKRKRGTEKGSEHTHTHRLRQKLHAGKLNGYECRSAEECWRCPEHQEKTFAPVWWVGVVSLSLSLALVGAHPSFAECVVACHHQAIEHYEHDSVNTQQWEVLSMLARTVCTYNTGHETGPCPGVIRW